MPELPEVAAMLSRIGPEIRGRRFIALKAVTREAGSLLHGDTTILRTSAALVTVERHGKISLFHFDTGAVIAIRLGMSGRLAMREPRFPHDHIALYLSGQTITYADHRRFGGVYVWPVADYRNRPPMGGVGPDALDEDLGEAVLPRGRRSVKEALLDQRVIAGLGNIYACETLYRAGIDPRRPCSGITRQERRRLIEAMQETLTEAVADGGATLEDYRGTEGESGSFESKFAVYGREGSKCPGCICEGSVVRIPAKGRSTWLCPTRQS